jgi:hypothetical protein
MDIRTLMNRLDYIEKNDSNIKNYLSEGLYSTPEMQQHWKRIDENFFKGYDSYLAEVALTPDQIQNIFKQVSGSAGAATKDPGKLAAIVDKVLPSSQAASLEQSLPEPTAGPVQGFEQKAAAAVQALPGADSATKQSLMQWIKQGVSKPETQQLILAAVGAGVGGLLSKVGPIISMIPGGGPVASAVTGAIIAGAVSVASAKLQGKDWKSAFKGAIKPALMGGASAVIGNLATTAVSAMTGGDKQPAAGADEPQQKRGAASGDMAPGDLDKMKQVPSNPDGSPMTPDQINAAKAGQQAGNAPAASGDSGITARPTGLQPLNNLDGSERPGAADANSGGAASGISARPTGLQPLNNLDGSVRPGAADANAGGIGKNFDAGIAPLGPDGTPMQAVPMDAPTTPPGINRLTGQPLQAAPTWDQMTPDQQAATLAKQQQQAADAAQGTQNARDYWANKNQAAPADTSTPQDINRLTGQPLQAAPTWDQMTPDQQAATLAKQQQQAASAAQGTQNAQDYWANKNPNTRGLKESFAESAYVDKQATLRMWLEQEAHGLAISGLALKPAVKEGIMDFFKGKGKGAAPAAGGVTPDVLNQAWTAAGSPTDSEEIAKVLQGAGVAPDAVNKIFADLKLPTPGAAPTATPPAGAAAQPSAPATAAAPAAGMKADEIVKALSTFWDQVKSNQDSRTGAPQVQQQIKQMAKDAAMTGQTFESKYWNNK